MRDEKRGAQPRCTYLFERREHIVTPGRSEREAREVLAQWVVDPDEWYLIDVRET